MDTWCANAALCSRFFITEFGFAGDSPGGEITKVLGRCAHPDTPRCAAAFVFHWYGGDVPGWGQFALLNSAGKPKNRFCTIEMHNTGRHVAPCPCSSGNPACAGIP